MLLHPLRKGIGTCSHRNIGEINPEPSIRGLTFDQFSIQIKREIRIRSSHYIVGRRSDGNVTAGTGNRKRLRNLQRIPIRNQIEIPGESRG